jgi:hypothetical protein
MTTLSEGVWATAFPTDTDEAALLLAAAGYEYIGVLRINNHDTGVQTYGFAVCLATGAATDNEWVAPVGTEIAAKRPPHEYSVHLGSGQEIRIQSGEASKVGFHFSGTRKYIG